MIFLIPFIIVIAVCPFVTHLEMVPIPESAYSFFKVPATEAYPFFADFFLRTKEILVFLCVIALNILGFFKKEFYVHWSLTPLVGFLFCLCLSHFFCKYPEYSILGFPSLSDGLMTWFSYYVLTLFAFQFIKTKEDIESIIAILFATMGMIAILALMEKSGLRALDLPFFKKIIFGSEIYNLNEGKLNFERFPKSCILFGNSNWAGSYFAMGIPIAYSFLLAHVNPKKATFHSLFLALFILALMATGSRAGVIGAISAVILVACLHKKIRHSIYLIGLTALFSAFQTYDMIVRFWSSSTYDRFTIWKNCIPILKQTLLLGVGPGNFPLYYAQDVVMKMDKPHSMYLQIWMTSGLVSLCFLVYLFGKYIHQTIWASIFCRDNLRTMRIGILGSVVAYLVAGIFNDNMISVAPTFFILLGIGLRMNEEAYL